MYEPAVNFILNNIEFDFGKASLKPSSEAALKNLLAYMKWKLENKIEISGHTDNIGSEAGNITLSKARAEAVKKYLTNKGIAAARITTYGYGATAPLQDNSTDAGRQKTDA